MEWAQNLTVLSVISSFLEVGGCLSLFQSSFIGLASPFLKCMLYKYMYR